MHFVSVTNGTTPTRFQQKTMDISNGALDLTRRINETLSRHGLDDRRSLPTYEPPPPPVRFTRRESKDREIVVNNLITPSSTGSWRRNSSSADLRTSTGSTIAYSNGSTTSTTPSTPQSPITSRYEIPEVKVTEPKIPDAMVTATKTVVTR